MSPKFKEFVKKLKEIIVNAWNAIVSLFKKEE